MSDIDWMALERACAESKLALPDCVPSNAREWDAFIWQYERALDLVEGRWEPHYEWNNKYEFQAAVAEQFYLGRGYKKSVYECLTDMFFINAVVEHPVCQNMDIDWGMLRIAHRFTLTNIGVSGSPNPCEKENGVWRLPKKLIGDFYGNKMRGVSSLVGAPEWVGGDFMCQGRGLKSLVGAPKHVRGDFVCHDNELSSFDGAPEYVGGNFICDRRMMLFDPSADGLKERISITGKMIALPNGGALRELREQMLRGTSAYRHVASTRYFTD